MTGRWLERGSTHVDNGVCGGFRFVVGFASPGDDVVVLLDGIVARDGFGWLLLLGRFGQQIFLLFLLLLLGRLFVVLALQPDALVGDVVDPLRQSFGFNTQGGGSAGSDGGKNQLGIGSVLERTIFFEEFARLNVSKNNKMVT